MKQFLAAIQFLTLFPTKKEFDELVISRSYVWFPVVGLLLGGLLAGADWVFSYFHFPQMPSTLLLVFFLITLTGGFHLDGLADTADGFFSARSREQILEIMKDSRIGTMGALALVFVVLLKGVSLLGIQSEKRTLALVFLPVVGRATQLWFLSVGKYARPEGGLGKVFLSSRKPYDRIWAFLWLILPLVFFFKLEGIIISVFIIGAMLFFHQVCVRKIGGITGDTIGAFTEISEALFLFLFSVLLVGWY